MRLRGPRLGFAFAIMLVTFAIPYNLRDAERKVEHKALSAHLGALLRRHGQRHPHRGTDTSGRAIAELLTAAGHTVAAATIVKDEPALVRGAIERSWRRPTSR